MAYTYQIRRILSYTRRAVDDFGMIEEGDRIAVGLSGGKDSLALLCALASLRGFYPKHFELEAVTMDPGFYKVGMELFYAEGAKTIRFLQEQNKQVFLDLKLHDIPNTVAHGVASLTRLGASLITLHGQGGPVMMKAAVEAARESGKELGVERPKLLAITALTSFDDESWTAIGGQLPISDQVIRLAKLAKDCGMDGVVCSALEAKMIREACGDDFLIVTPGIRPSFATTDDQKRVATPASALQDGASRLVIGRPITQAENPREAVRLIIEEMEKVSK